MAGIVETKEALVGVFEIAVHVAKASKSGGVVQDALAFYNDLMNDADFKAKVVAGYQGISAVPAELSDISLGEAIELGTVAIGYVPKVIDALK